jgi:hypothetical protein
MHLQPRVAADDQAGVVPHGADDGVETDTALRAATDADSAWVSGSFETNATNATR